MSRKSLILCLAVLAVMIVGIGAALYVLYSGTGETAKAAVEKVGDDSKFALLPAVPSDAVMLCCFADAGKCLERIYSGTEFPKALKDSGVQGSSSLRIYDSAKDHCKKAGIQINVRTLELLGGSTDKVPSRLYSADGTTYEVTKYFHCGLQGGLLKSSKGEEFAVDDNGWVVPRSECPASQDSQSQH